MYPQQSDANSTISHVKYAKKKGRYVIFGKNLCKNNIFIMVRTTAFKFTAYKRTTAYNSLFIPVQ